MGACDPTKSLQQSPQRHIMAQPYVKVFPRYRGIIGQRKIASFALAQTYGNLLVIEVEDRTR
jgi:hypothetical protein